MTRSAYDSNPGFAPEEIQTDQPTGKARLKWVVVVDDSLAPGHATNAAICVAAATSPAVAGFLGSDAKDADGSAHPGLPWAGCTVLTAPASELARLRGRAAASDGVFVADMPAAAQETRVYDAYVEAVESTPGDELRYRAVSVVGPRNRIAKMVHGMAMLG
ncbi:Protein of unknown function [Pseudonocardia ammonioxydans]|uniref:DUF2000 domain-containing protein n=1 Tax=Pseudonocardia ammonioxydans TaxID=260086 RepID=A0A1I4V4U4_PSUAM|nr:DUF2000 domain-containing protein [Pseudonocardia ammonioxydans]SFM96185.1 Protein of unknown function [Pseudonocardia ammonioxydans]